MVIENEMDAHVSGFHLDALSSGLPLNVDLDTTLTVLAGNCYRLLARKLPLNELATPDRLWRHFLDTTGKVVVNGDHVRVDLALRTYTPVLIDTGFPELDVAIPWWEARLSDSGSHPAEPRCDFRNEPFRGSRLGPAAVRVARLSWPPLPRPGLRWRLRAWPASRPARRTPRVQRAPSCPHPSGLTSHDAVPQVHGPPRVPTPIPAGHSPLSAPQP